MSRSLWIACIAALLLTACDSGSPTAPSAPGGPRTGTWTGTLSDPVNGTGTVRLVLSDYAVDSERSLFSGTWTATYADSAKNGSGAASGTVAGGSGSLTLSPAIAPGCPPGTVFGVAAGSYVAVNLTIGGSTMTGAYLLATCTGSVTGAVDLRKQ